MSHNHDDDVSEKEREERYEGRSGQFDKDENLDQGPIRSVEGYVIFVSNIHDEATEEDILDLFSDAGKVAHLQMPLDRRTGYVKGYALIEYQEFDEAEKAIKDLDQTSFRGKVISVNWAFYGR